MGAVLSTRQLCASHYRLLASMFRAAVLLLYRLLLRSCVYWLYLKPWSVNTDSNRWIAEALCPHIDKVLPPAFRAPHAFGNLATLRGCNYPPALMSVDDREKYDGQFNQLIDQLRQKRTVLVGHNVFLDLVYFYTFFFGPLPDLVKDFQQIIEYLFPMVFDTKYLADKINDNSSSYNSSLEDLDRELSELPLPIIGTLDYISPYN